MVDSKLKICIIGGGPAGIIAAKYLAPFADIKGYEAHSSFGGLWL